MYQRRLQDVENDPTDNPEYRIQNGSLLRHVLHTLHFNEYGPEEEWKVCVPREEQQRIMKEVHDCPTAGHLGIAKTLSRLSRLSQVARNAQDEGQTLDELPQLPKAQGPTTGTSRTNARDECRTALGHGLCGPNRAAAPIQLRKHMTPGRTRPFHQVGRAPTTQEGHQPSCRNGHHGPDLPATWLPPDNNFRQRPAVHRQGCHAFIHG